MSKTPNRLENSSVGYFFDNKRLEGQLALYRGYLHEVNNTLAGIGGLAEALKGAKNDPQDAHLDLISGASAKAANLQRRIRALITPSETLEFDLVEFVGQNRDLMELMLPRNQKLAIALPVEALKIKTSIDKAWTLLSVVLLWIRESQSPQVALEVSGSLKISLMGSPIVAHNVLWAEAIEKAAEEVGAHGFVSANEITVAWR